VSFVCVVESAFLEQEQKPGAYNTQFKLQAEPDPSCDPTQQPCENWLPGLYTVHVGEYIG
jgi:hypothetical protein